MTSIEVSPKTAPRLERSRPAEPLGRILVAEDDDAMRALLAELLSRAGYEVMLAEDGLHLVTQLDWYMSDTARPAFDAVVSDVRMPGANGLHILERLRARTTRLPVVLITAFGTAELHAEARRLGARILDKPLDLDLLVATLRDMLGRAAAC